jgi:hypothetical protein
VAWTPGSYYAASPGGEDLIGWHVNRGPGHAERGHAGCICRFDSAAFER